MKVKMTVYKEDITGDTGYLKDFMKTITLGHEDKELFYDFDTKEDMYSDYTYTVLKVYFEREETPEEQSIRQSKLLEVKSNRECKELEELKRLQAKYPNFDGSTK